MPKPFLKPAMDALNLELKAKMSDAFIKMAAEMLDFTKKPNPYRMMAHPASPWKFGTVLRPKYDAPSRVMWIGDRQVMWIGREDGSEVTGPATINPEHWEPVPEPDA